MPPAPVLPSAQALAAQFLDAAGVLGLQGATGNRAVSRMLEGGPGHVLGRAALQRDGDPLSAEPYDAARDARRDWVADGLRGPEDFRSSTGRGGFNVSYSPAAQELSIRLNGAVDFEDGIELYMGMFASANQPTAPVQAAATAINRLPRAQRAAAVAAWAWQGADKASFLQDFGSAVVSAWAGRYEFHCTRHFWEDLGATVSVEVDVHEGSKGDEDHMKLTTYKIAANAAAGGVGVVSSSSAGFFDNGSQNNEMTLNSTDVTARSDIMLTQTAAFSTPGDVQMDATNTGKVQTFGSTYKGGGGPRCGTCGQEIAGLAGTPIHAKIQGSGADAEANARARLATVTAALTAGGMTSAPQFEFDGNGEGLTLVVGSGAQQTVAAHEAGHMFGLGDEYTAPFSGTGRPLGTPIDGNIGPSQNLPGAVAENTDSIMSVGAAVKPQHYATFLEALKDVSGMTDWAFGPPTAVLPPGADGPDQPQHREGSDPSQASPQQPQSAVA
jgi:hypothetical protein